MKFRSPAVIIFFAIPMYSSTGMAQEHGDTDPQITSPNVQTVHGTTPQSASSVKSLSSIISTIPNDCEKFDTPEWHKLINKLSTEIQNNDLDNAINDAIILDKMCNQTPMLNYMMTIIANKRNDVESAKFFIQRASDYTYKYAVTPANAKKIWFTRYELENPNLTEAKFNQMQDEIESLTKAFHGESEEAQNAYRDLQKKELYTQMWTGAGIGLAGIAVAVTGTALMAAYHDTPVIYHEDYDNSGHSFPSANINGSVRVNPGRCCPDGNLWL